MKKLLCLVLTLVMILSVCVPVTAAETETEPTFVPESFTREELLAMNQELDSDGDGLVDVIELVYKFNRYNPDTDGDGVTDYTEFCITCTDPLVPDGDIDTDGDGLTNAEEAVYGTNPDDLDSDNDNLGDFDEITVHMTDPTAKDTDDDGVYDAVELENGLNPLAAKTNGVTPDAQRPEVAELKDTLITSGVSSLDPENSVGTNAIDPSITPVDPGAGSDSSVFSGTLHTEYNGSSYTSSVSYTLNYDYFFGSNTVYRPTLATVSSLLSAIAYDNNRLDITSGGTMTSTNATAVWDWMDFHGFVHPNNSYDLDYHKDNNPNGYQDQHVSEMFVGHKPVTYNGTTKNIICIVIRGTNGTLDEWQSNFDVGGDSTPHNEWTASLNHMGFDITVNRLSTKLSSYMSSNGLNSSNSVLWFTGHSRGAALANLLAAKRVNAGYNVFAYTFASPGTTISTNTRAAKYSCIFNIINEDDLVPQLPMSAWGFNRYGVDKPGSVEDDYAGQWDALVSGTDDYTSAKTPVANAVAILGNIADNRDQCYTYRTGLDAYYVDALYPTYESAQIAVNSIVNGYPSNTSGTYYWVPTGSAEYYGYAMYHKPAFFMQLLAAQMSGQITAESFGLTVVAPYLKPSKHALSALAIANSICHPHYVESYYLLSLYVTVSD